jgi:hypothetical protein
MVQGQAPNSQCRISRQKLYKSWQVLSRKVLHLVVLQDIQMAMSSALTYFKPLSDQMRLRNHRGKVALGAPKTGYVITKGGIEKMSIIDVATAKESQAKTDPKRCEHIWKKWGGRSGSWLLCQICPARKQMIDEKWVDRSPRGEPKSRAKAQPKSSVPRAPLGVNAGLVVPPPSAASLSASPLSSEAYHLVEEFQLTDDEVASNFTGTMEDAL